MSQNPKLAESDGSRPGDGSESWQEVVRRHVGSLRYGRVQIVVHEGRVIQIERTERVRLDEQRRASGT